MMWIKNNFETTIINYDFKKNCKTTVCDCGFKDISKTFKITVINDGFLHLKYIYIYIYVCVDRKD